MGSNIHENQQGHAEWRLYEIRKKEAARPSVNSALLRTIDPGKILVDIRQAGEAEVDEMGSFVGKQRNQRWLWYAIDHHTGQVLASVFGQLKALMGPCGLTRFYTDYWGAYKRHLEPDMHSPGKRNTQKIERKRLT
jgi:hypothetical protein